MGTTKKQHFVPRMYLKMFCNDGTGNRCYEYNKHTKKIRNVLIEDICAENYIYEIRNKEGEFVIPELKNKLEEDLSKIEHDDAELLKNIVEKIEQEDKNYVLIENKERKELLDFIMLMILRNKVTRSVLPDTYKFLTNKEISKKEEISFLWIFLISLIDQFSTSLNNTEIVFLRNKSDTPFITSSIPMFFSGFPIQRDFYMPLSPYVAIILKESECILKNLNRCEVKDVDKYQTDRYNTKLLSRDDSLICSDEKTLIDYIKYMDKYDSGILYDNTSTYLKLLQNLSNEYHVYLVKLFVEEEITAKNEVFCEKYGELMNAGLSEYEAKIRMSRAIEEDFMNGLLINSKIELEKINQIISNLKV